MLLFIGNRGHHFHHLHYNSNTSHVIVYRRRSIVIIIIVIIQIHLMLLFIMPVRLPDSPQAYSNTSHVIVYRGSLNLAGGSRCRFKYISCYCLSGTIAITGATTPIQIHLMLLFIGELLLFLTHKSAFKYISCYCLSYNHQTECMLLFLFKYISCYCLSVCSIQRTTHDTIIQIHLMLLFIVPERPFIGPGEDSNTSHVIVYHCPKSFTEDIDGFKYISCYCLSPPGIKCRDPQ